MGTGRCKRRRRCDVHAGCLYLPGSWTRIEHGCQKFCSCGSSTSNSSSRFPAGSSQSGRPLQSAPRTVLRRCCLLCHPGGSRYLHSLDGNGRAMSMQDGRGQVRVRDRTLFTPGQVRAGSGPSLNNEDWEPPTVEPVLGFNRAKGTDLKRAGGGEKGETAQGLGPRSRRSRSTRSRSSR
jgi:hypothetical protein